MENFIDSMSSVLEYCWDTAGNSITGWTKMPKYDKFDLLYSVKLEYLICSLVGILPEVTFPPYLIPRRKQKGGNVVRKGNPRSFFSPLTWHIHMPLPEQMATTFSPLLHTFRLFGEFFPSSILPWKWTLNWFHFYEHTPQSQGMYFMMFILWCPHSLQMDLSRHVLFQVCLTLLQENLQWSLEPTWSLVGNKIKTSGVSDFFSSV